MLKKNCAIAKSLINSGCLKFGNFKLKSDVVSPYYIDLTWLLSSPKDFNMIVNMIVEEIKKILAIKKITKLASIELKGALILPSVATKLNLPCIILRKKIKGYGITGRIVGGEIKKGEKIIFFDDVVTSGKSKIEGIEPILKVGGIIENIMVVVDREQGGIENLTELGYTASSITKISEIVNCLKSQGHINEKKKEEILQYIKNYEKN